MKMNNDISKLQYNLKEDIEFFSESTDSNVEEFAKEIEISKTTIYEIMSNNMANEYIVEKIYSYIYKRKYRLNAVKEEMLREMNPNLILFHGSKQGLKKIGADGSRSNCDFGPGFYLGESYFQAISFVCENKNSCVYSFSLDKKDMKILRFDIELDWMLAISFYRGTIKKYENHKRIKKIIDKIDKADLIIAPIADNRMFYVMNSFANGDINVEVALHSLSASKLGMQYVLKTNKAIDKLKPIEKYYLSAPEKADYICFLERRADEIETKLELAKREYRDGLYIEEILK